MLEITPKDVRVKSVSVNCHRHRGLKYFKSINHQLKKKTVSPLSLKLSMKESRDHFVVDCPLFMKRLGPDLPT